MVAYKQNVVSNEYKCFLDTFAPRKPCATVSNQCAKSTISFNYLLDNAEISELTKTLCFIGKGAKGQKNADWKIINQYVYITIKSSQSITSRAVFL